jgi:hypothetical protein
VVSVAFLLFHREQPRREVLYSQNFTQAQGPPVENCVFLTPGPCPWLVWKGRHRHSLQARNTPGQPSPPGIRLCY